MAGEGEWGSPCANAAHTHVQLPPFSRRPRPHQPQYVALQLAVSRCELGNGRARPRPDQKAATVGWRNGVAYQNPVPMN